MAELLRVENLSFAYPPLLPGDASQPILSEVSFSLQAGEFVAILGGSGAGKTTLCHIIAGLAPALTGGELRGQAIVRGADGRSLAGLVGYVFQDAADQLFSMSVEAEVAWGLEALAVPRAEMAARIDWALRLTGLDQARQRAPLTLSAGQQKRLALAATLATRPALLLLDEPLGGLDPVGAAEMLRTLADLRREYGAAVLLATSDPEIAVLADRLLILQSQPAGATISLAGSPGDVFRQLVQADPLAGLMPELAQLAQRLNGELGADFAFFTEPEAVTALSAALRDRP